MVSQSEHLMSLEMVLKEVSYLLVFTKLYHINNLATLLKRLQACLVSESVLR